MSDLLESDLKVGASDLLSEALSISGVSKREKIQCSFIAGFETNTCFNFACFGLVADCVLISLCIEVNSGINILLLML